jgi:hypothetical protein
MMPRRKNLGVIDVTWGSDRLCVKIVKYSHRELPDTRPEIGYCDICSENLEALSIQVPLILRMKFILGRENVNTQKKKVKPKTTPSSLLISELAATWFLLMISESAPTQFLLMISKSTRVMCADEFMCQLWKQFR